MDKFSYAIGLGIGQNLLGMGAKGISVEDFAQAIKDVLEGNQTAISHQEAREIVNKYFEELEQKMSAASIEQGKAFLEENKKKAGVVTLPSGLQYEIITEGKVSEHLKEGAVTGCFSYIFNIAGTDTFLACCYSSSRRNLCACEVGFQRSHTGVDQ